MNAAAGANRFNRGKVILPVLALASPAPAGEGRSEGSRWF